MAVLFTKCAGREDAELTQSAEAPASGKKRICHNGHVIEVSVSAPGHDEDCSATGAIGSECSCVTTTTVTSTMPSTTTITSTLFTTTSVGSTTIYSTTVMSTSVAISTTTF
jgi:hypothetical protein